MAPHSRTLAWKIPWSEEPGGLQSMGSLQVGHDWATSLSLFTFMHWRRKLKNPRDGGAWWAAVYGVAQSRTRLKRLSGGSSRRQRSLARHSPCGHREADTTGWLTHRHRLCNVSLKQFATAFINETSWNDSFLYNLRQFLILTQFYIIFKKYLETRTDWKKRKFARSCLTLRDPLGCNPPGSSVRSIFQARMLEWVSTSAGDLPNPGPEPRAPALQADSCIQIQLEPPGRLTLD